MRASCLVVILNTYTTHSHVKKVTNQGRILSGGKKLSIPERRKRNLCSRPISTRRNLYALITVPFYLGMKYREGFHCIGQKSRRPASASYSTAFPYVNQNFWLSWYLNFCKDVKKLIITDIIQRASSKYKNYCCVS